MKLLGAVMVVREVVVVIVAGCGVGLGRGRTTDRMRRGIRGHGTGVLGGLCRQGGVVMVQGRGWGSTAHSR